MQLIFVTSNEHKAAEVRHMLGIDIKVNGAELPEIQSLSTQENARHKAYAAYKLVKKTVIVEDTGLYIKGFGGFPGALVKWYMKGVGWEGMCRAVDLCKTRSAYGETCIVLYDGKIMKSFIGKVDGNISMHPKGDNNFGWDHVFIPKGYKKTFAEMTLEEKAKISERGIAVRKLKKLLKGNK